MSLLSMVEQTIKSYKAEQAKINASIQLYREILQSLTPQLKPTPEETKADTSAADTSTSPGEKEDIELLEQALEKALQVRTASRTSEKQPQKKQPGPRNEPSTTCKNTIQPSAPCKGSKQAIRSTSKSASLDRKFHKNPQTFTLGSKPLATNNPAQSKTTKNKNQIRNHTADGNLKKANSSNASLTHISTLHVTVRSNSDNLDKDTTVSSPAIKTLSLSDTDEFGATSLRQQKGKPSEQLEKWKSLRMKQNRLWDKVTALQKKSMPEKSHFMERIRLTFPTGWPSGSPDQIRALVDRVTHQGHDLTQHCQTKKLLAIHSPDVATDLVSTGGKENKYDCNLTLGRISVTPSEFQDCAHKVKEEWEAWDRWRPKGGCLCPTGANIMFRNEVIEPLPLTITYTTEAELRELENLRMRVALLQQQMYLEQVLLDNLFPQISSLLAGPGCPKSSLLRDIYSLLGEGGECFPAIVLDSDSD